MCIFPRLVLVGKRSRLTLHSHTLTRMGIEEDQMNFQKFLLLVLWLHEAGWELKLKDLTKKCADLTVKFPFLLGIQIWWSSPGLWLRDIVVILSMSTADKILVMMPMSQVRVLWSINSETFVLGKLVVLLQKCLKKDFYGIQLWTCGPKH